MKKQKTKIKISKKQKSSKKVMFIVVTLLIAIVLFGAFLYLLIFKSPFKYSIATKETKSAYQISFEQLQRQYKELADQSAAWEGQYNKCVKTSSEEWIKSGNYILRHLNVGDVLAGMKIAKIEPAAERLSPEFYQISFTGEKTLSGWFVKEEIFEKKCFYSPEAQFPSILEEDETQFFCFKNDKSFTFPGNGVEATIKINNFELIVAPREGSDLADLVAVVSKKGLCESAPMIADGSTSYPVNPKYYTDQLGELKTAVDCGQARVDQVAKSYPQTFKYSLMTKSQSVGLTELLKKYKFDCQINDLAEGINDCATKESLTFENLLEFKPYFEELNNGSIYE